MMYSARMLAVLFCICHFSFGAYANSERVTREALLRKAVLAEVRSTPSCVQAWGMRIDQLKHGLKQTLSNSGKSMSRATMQEMIPSSDMVHAVSTHLCETGGFSQSLHAEMLWYSERKASVLSSDNIEALSDQDVSEEETFINPEDPGLDFNRKSEAQVFFTNPLFSFLLGIVLGFSLVHYVLLLKQNSDTSVGMNRLRRPEL